MKSELGDDKVVDEYETSYKNKVKDVIRRHWIEVRDYSERWDEPWDFDEDFNLVRVALKRSKVKKSRVQGIKKRI